MPWYRFVQCCCFVWCLTFHPGLVNSVRWNGYYWVLEISTCEHRPSLMHIHVFAKQMYKYTFWVSENWYPLSKITISSVYLPELASVGQERGERSCNICLCWHFAAPPPVLSRGRCEGELKVEKHLLPGGGMRDWNFRWISLSVSNSLVIVARERNIKSTDSTLQLFSSTALIIMPTYFSLTYNISMSAGLCKVSYLMPVLLKAGMTGEVSSVVDDLQLPEDATAGEDVHGWACHSTLVLV